MDEGTVMGRFIEGEDRGQVSLMPECLDDYIAQENPVRVIDAFVGELDLVELGSSTASSRAAVSSVSASATSS
jgi:transposase